MVRSYDMTHRNQLADDTRAKIIEAAHALLAEPDGGGLSVQDVAEAAGVSRATVYNRIGTRRDLLTAVFEDQGRLIGFDRVLLAMSRDDAGEAVEAMLRESGRAWEVMPVAIRRTLALAAIDPEVRELVQQFERYRREALTGLARRVAFSDDMSLDVSTIADTLSLLSSFPAYDHLRLDHDHEAAVDRLVLLARLSLANPIS